MGPGRDRTRDPWISSQTRICCQTRYRLRYAAEPVRRESAENTLFVIEKLKFVPLVYFMCFPPLTKDVLYICCEYMQWHFIVKRVSWVGVGEASKNELKDANDNRHILAYFVRMRRKEDSTLLDLKSTSILNISA